MKKPRFLKQKNMLRVLYALVPVALVSMYYFGWRVAVICAIAGAFAFLTEWVMTAVRNKKLSYAVFVTAALYGLSLPPTTPFWIVAVGAIIAILFGKEVFGGFGKNIFNPAIVGRGFVYVAFPIELTSDFVPVFTGFPGGFTRWSFASLNQAPDYLARAGISIADAVSAATPMWARRDYGYFTDFLNLAIGNIGAVFEYEGQRLALTAGSAGELSAIAILAAGAYLIWTKTAQWRLTTATLAGAMVTSAVFRYVFGMDTAPDPLFTLLSGALCYAAVFMVTDPVSAPKLPSSQWIYGAFIGVMVAFFRLFSIFAGGVAFSILLGNMLAPSLDYWIKRLRGPTPPGKPATKKATAN